MSEFPKIILPEESKEGPKYSFVNIGESQNTRRFEAVLESYDGRLDIIVHPFYADNEDFHEEPDVIKYYGQDYIDKMRKVSERGIAATIRRYSTRDHTDKNSRLPLIMQEVKEIKSLSNSLQERGISCAKDLFVIGTKTGSSVPYIPNMIHSQRDEGIDISREHDDRDFDAYVYLFNYLCENGMHDVRVLGGYSHLKSFVTGVEIDNRLTRCAGEIFTLFNHLNDELSRDRQLACITLSNFAYPENRSSLKRKVALD